MSRYPLLTPLVESEEENFADDIGVHTAAMDTLYATSNLVSWEMMKAATAEDETLTHLREEDRWRADD